MTTDMLVDTARLLHACKGASLHVLVALVACSKPVGVSALQRLTGCNLETVRIALGTLEALGYAQNLGGHQGWLPTADARQLPLFSPAQLAGETADFPRFALEASTESAENPRFGESSDASPSYPQVGESAENPRFAAPAPEPAEPQTAENPRIASPEPDESAENPRIEPAENPPHTPPKLVSKLINTPSVKTNYLTQARAREANGDGQNGDALRLELARKRVQHGLPGPADGEEIAASLRLLGDAEIGLTGRGAEILADVFGFEHLYRLAKTFQRKKREGSVYSAGVLVSWCGGDFGADALADDYYGDPLRLRALGADAAAAGQAYRRARYVPAAYESIIEH